jgi:hypothetical protein
MNLGDHKKEILYPKFRVLQGASEEEFILGMSDQSTTLVRMMTKEANFKDHSTAHSL